MSVLKIPTVITIAITAAKAANFLSDGYLL